MPAPTDATRVREFCQRYESGQSTPSIAREFGVNRDTVRHWLARHGIARRPRDTAGKWRRLKADAFSQIETEAQAYWLGFLAADGSVMARSHGHRLYVGLSAIDESHLVALQAFLETDAPILRYITSGRCARPAAGLLVCSKGLVADLCRHGVVPRKSLTLQPPAVRAELERHWIRGLFDGDGSVYERMHGRRQFLMHGWRIVTTKAVAMWIARVFEKALGLTAQRKISPATRRTTAVVITYMGRHQVGAICRWLYADATICLARKHVVASQIIASLVRPRYARVQ